MAEVTRQIENLILSINGSEISNITKDEECEEYAGCSFQMNSRNIKFRKAKITPKKSGQFVTLWKRNNKNQTEPFNLNDDFDFYMIATQQHHRFGFFLFSKDVLSKWKILTTGNKQGKRGFRVYSNWDIPESKQAEMTKNWQSQHFFDATYMDHLKLEEFLIRLKFSIGARR